MRIICWSRFATRCCIRSSVQVHGLQTCWAYQLGHVFEPLIARTGARRSFVVEVNIVQVLNEVSCGPLESFQEVLYLLWTMGSEFDIDKRVEERAFLRIIAHLHGNGR
jgi:hypothetical protein